MTAALSLKVPAKKGSGRIVHVTPESAGWTYVGFDLYRLKTGESASGITKDREACLVFVTGKGHVTADQTSFGELGERMGKTRGVVTSSPTAKNSFIRPRRGPSGLFNENRRETFPCSRSISMPTSSRI